MKDLLYKPGDVVDYTPSFNVIALDLPNAKFYGRSAQIINAEKDKFGWPRYKLLFECGETLQFVSNDSINQTQYSDDLSNVAIDDSDDFTTSF
jgi:hypothetical protein